MLSLLGRSVAVLAALQSTLGVASPVAPPTKGLEERDGGYTNAVYFTNWCVKNMRVTIIYHLTGPKGYLWEELPAK